MSRPLMSFSRGSSGENHRTGAQYEARRARSIFGSFPFHTMACTWSYCPQGIDSGSIVKSSFWARAFGAALARRTRHVTRVVSRGDTEPPAGGRFAGSAEMRPRLYSQGRGADRAMIVAG